MMRVGIGYDIHRLVRGRMLVLGGVHVPFELGLAGHSDADVLSHAIIDALLGAAGLGNIGQRFPDTDEKYMDAYSLNLLAETVQLVKHAGYEILNVDSTLIAQQPRLNPYVEEIAATLAEVLGIRPQAVSVKPKTNEGFGPEGQGEAMSAHAVALINRF